MSAHIADLLDALRNEVVRITEKTASEDKREELTEVLITSINKTLKEIKSGADSDEFHDLTVINFVIAADDAGFEADAIRKFVQELKKTDDSN